MTLKKFFPLLFLTIAAACAFLVHRLVFMLGGTESLEEEFYYSLAQVYLFFSACSIFIVIILIFVRYRNIDNVGYTFLLLTFAKMAGAYAMLYPMLQREAETLRIEKLNFFLVFAIFLVFETIATIRLLNKK